VNHGNLPTDDAGPIFVASARQVWFATENYLSGSSDGGRNWTTFRDVSMEGGGGLATFSFVDPTHGWLVGAGGPLWRTTNGRTWTRVVN
jgi:photosystem II stability/assembly factor-like uncharacterized protein